MAATTTGYLAGGTIRPSRFVKIGTTDFSCLEADANEITIGISQEGGREAPIPSVTTVNAAESGDSVQVYQESEECLLELGGTVAVGGRIKSDADGKGVAVATTGTTVQESGAFAAEAGVSGDLIRVRVQNLAIRPALV